MKPDVKVSTIAKPTLNLTTFKRRTLIILIALAVSLAAFGWSSFKSLAHISSNKAASIKAPQPVSRVMAQLGDSGRPWINFADARSAAVSYRGSEAPRTAIGDNLARPLALASADFDEDGVMDFVGGYQFSGIGVFSLLRGSADSIYPNSPEAQSRRLEGRFIDSPFALEADAFESQMVPEFLAAGDFDNDGHIDLAAASRQSDHIQILRGDGRGGFSPLAPIALPGRVTAMTSGDFNRQDGLADIAVAVVTNGKGQLMVFESAVGAFKAEPEIFALPAQAASIVAGQFDADYPTDIAVAAGSTLVMVRGRDRKTSLDQSVQARVPQAVVDKRSFKFQIKSIAAGDFTADQETDIALLADDGKLHLLGYNAGDLKKWTVKELASVGASSSHLTAARMSSLAGESLVVTDTTNGRVDILADSVGRGEEEALTKPPALVSTTFNIEGGVSAVMPARLNGDGISDLVIIGSSQNLISYVLSAPAATFSVTNTANSGPGSLRQALLDANASAGADTINFSIGSGVQTISPTADFPGILSVVTIDGTTQPGFAGTPLIVLNGTNMPSGGGLKVAGGNSVVRGLVVNRCSSVGVQFLKSGGNLIEGCFLGTDPTGTMALPNGTGVSVFSIPNNTVGGTTAAARNLISANHLGLSLGGPTNGGNFVQGNFIGTTADGSADLGNTDNGIRINALNNLIGGTAPGAGNVISGNDDNGIQLLTTPNITGNMIQGNRIGTNAAGDAALPNDLAGVAITGTTATTVGGTAMGAGNLIAGNTGDGIALTLATADSNTIQGNTIGTSALPNGGKGVSISEGSNNTVGGSVVGAGNTISFNGDDGVAVISGIENRISRNSIFSNTGLGIDLGDNGVTPNDPNDPDTGANQLQNFPVIASCTGGSTTRIVGTFNSNPNTQFTLEFFLNGGCDASGFGEGELFIGSTSVTTNASGNASFDVTLMAGSVGGLALTMTATSASGNTSEFSQCCIICSFTINPTSQNFSETGGTGNIDVTAPNGCAWTAVSNNSFITITSGATGSGNGTVNFSVAVNPNNVPRTGTITVAEQTFTVNQAANPGGCLFELMPTSENFTAAGGTGSVSVNTGLGCDWTAVSNDSFITVTSGATGSGPGTVNYSVAANPDAIARTGTITIGGETFTVNQDPVPCVFNIDPTSQSFPQPGGSGMVNVSAPVGCDWTAVSNAAFITVTGGATGSGPGVVSFTVDPNPGTSPRIGTMTIGGLTFTVNQQGNCTFTISPTVRNFVVGGGTGMITVTAADETCTRTAVPDVPWITITQGASGTGSGTVRYSVAPNTSGSKRTGRINIEGRIHTVTQGG